MTKAGATPDGTNPSSTSKPFCRCEATIPKVILEGYACGNPDCWRTPVVQASFDGFLADLIRARGTAASSETETADNH